MQTTNAFLLALPFETRQAILKHVFRGSDTTLCGRRNGRSCWTPRSYSPLDQDMLVDWVAFNTFPRDVHRLAITRACQQLRCEALPLAASSMPLNICCIPLRQLTQSLDKSYLQQLTTITADEYGLLGEPACEPSTIVEALPALRSFSIGMRRRWDIIVADDMPDHWYGLDGAGPESVYEHLNVCNRGQGGLSQQEEDFLTGLHNLDNALSVRVCLELQDMIEYSRMNVVLDWPSEKVIDCDFDYMEKPEQEAGDDSPRTMDMSTDGGEWNDDELPAIIFWARLLEKRRLRARRLKKPFLPIPYPERFWLRMIFDAQVRLPSLQAPGKFVYDVVVACYYQFVAAFYKKKFVKKKRKLNQYSLLTTSLLPSNSLRFQAHYTQYHHGTFTKMASLTNTQSSTLLTLPFEVRQNIIKHVFRNSFVAIAGRHPPGTSRGASAAHHRRFTSIAADFCLAIGQTCQQLRIEATPIATASVRLSMKDVSLEQLCTVIPRRLLQQARTIKVNMSCFFTVHDRWRCNEILVAFPALQVLCIHEFIHWETVRQESDKDFADVIRDLSLVSDRVVAHFRAPHEETLSWHHPLFNELPNAGIAKHFHLELQVRNDKYAPPRVRVNLEWPSFRVISSVVDNHYEFAHGGNQTRQSAIGETLGPGQVETAASA